MAEETPKSDSLGTKPIGRRDFVKTSMKIAAGGALVAGAAPMVVPLSYNTRKIKRFPYVGAFIIPPGPAPQGVPLIPVKVNAKGEVEGVPENKKSNIPHSLDWYKYCSHEAAPGLDPAFTDDNALRYYINPEKISKAREQGLPLWFAEKIGEKAMASDLAEIGSGAPFRWRSEGQEGTNVITGILIKVDPAKIKGKLPEGFVWDNKDGTGLLAVCSFCAHFCCVPGYLENNNPKAHVKGRGINDTVIYCSCHDSRYDFMEVKQYQFPPDF